MKTFLNKSIWKYTVFLLLPLVLISAFLSYVLYRQDSSAAYAVIKSQEFHTLDFDKTILNNHLEELSKDIEYCSSLKVLNDFVKTDFKDGSRIEVFLASFIKRKKVYSSVRIIDSSGLERFRLNYSKGKVDLVPQDKLQEKGKRYYFNEIMRMNHKYNYFSSFDFNYEEGALVLPLQPVLRVARIILGPEGTKRAFIILNYDGNNILRSMAEQELNSPSSLYLRNKDTSIIPLNKHAGANEKIVKQFLSTSEGRSLLDMSESQIRSDYGLFTYKKVDLSGYGNVSEWHLISFIPENILEREFSLYKRRSYFVFLVLFLVSLVLALVIALNKEIKADTERNLKEKARFFESNPAPVLKITQRGKIISSNSAAKEILAISPPDYSVHDTFASLGRESIDKLLQAKLPSFEYSVKDKILHFSVTLDEESAQIYLYGSDITETARMRDEIRKFQLAVQQSANVIVFTDLEGRVLFANRAFEAVTGYSAEEVIGKTPGILSSGYHSKLFYQNMWDTIKGGKVWSGEFYNKRKNGELFWEKSTITPVLDSLGTPEFFIAVKEDITQRKVLERELEEKTIAAEKAKEAAESADLMKSNFLANMSHEIRTPMNAIMGFTRLLLENKTDEKDRETLEIILNSSEHLLDLINDILDISKIEADAIELYPVKINFPMFLEDIYNLFYLQVRQKGLDFKTVINKGVPDVIYGDENRIRQIIINLVGNALKFTENGSITVEAAAEDGKIKIKVSDTGIGIPPEQINNIFSQFKQVDSAINRKFQGTGLGLPISKKLAQMMGGDIEVKSTPGKGSVFTFYFPLEIPEEASWSARLKTLVFEDNSSDLKDVVDSWLLKSEHNPVVYSLILKAIREFPEVLGNLKNLIDLWDVKKLRFLVHELAGSYGNLGMDEIAGPLKEMNIVLGKENVDRNQVVLLYRSLENLLLLIPKDFGTEDPWELLPMEEENLDINVLVADDNESNRKLFGALLSSIKVGADFAENGVQVLQKIKDKKYDLLILDIQMPEMDGRETISHIRKDPANKEIIVIAVTANALSRDKNGNLQYGFNDYISKPVENDVFRKKMGSYIRCILEGRNKDEAEIPPSELNKIISLLEKEVNIFNPERVRNIAALLTSYSGDARVKTFINELNRAAETFDSERLRVVMDGLKRM